SAELGPPYEVEAVPAGPEDFGQECFDDLEALVGKLAGPGGLLVVQVATVFDALHLLGYHHSHPFILGRGRGRRPPGFATFRVRQASASNPSSWWAGAGQAKINAELALLETRLQRGRDVYSKLRVILERCAILLGCTSGEIAVRDTDRR